MLPEFSFPTVTYGIEKSSEENRRLTGIKLWMISSYCKSLDRGLTGRCCRSQFLEHNRAARLQSSSTSWSFSSFSLGYVSLPLNDSQEEEHETDESHPQDYDPVHRCAEYVH